MTTKASIARNLSYSAKIPSYLAQEFTQSFINLIIKKKFFLRNFITFFYRYTDLVITFSEQNKLFLKNKIKVKNVKVIYNYFPQYMIPNLYSFGELNYHQTHLLLLHILFYLSHF